MLWYFPLIIINTEYSNSLPEVETEVLRFGIDNITISLSWTQQESSIISYNVSIVPQELMMVVQGLESITVHLTVSYNIWYIVSIVGTLCERNISSTAVELNYGEQYQLLSYC